jgi:hypothetical protein
MTARALFVDRDGTIDHLVHYDSSGEYEAPRSRADVVLIGGAIEALLQAMDGGWRLFVVTNQPSAMPPVIARSISEGVRARAALPKRADERGGTSLDDSASAAFSGGIQRLF